MSVDEVWVRQQQWSIVAGARSRLIARLRWINLGLVVVGAVAGVVATQSWLWSGWSGPVAGTGAVLLAIATLVQASGLGSDRVKDRVAARAASESLKAAVYVYRSGVAPQDGGTRDQVLEATNQRVRHEGASLLPEVLETTIETAAALPPEGIAAYVSGRAEGQFRFHERRGRDHSASARRWHIAEIVATGVAAVLSAVSGLLGITDLSAWVGVVTTIAGAVTAHIAAEQHTRISASYAVTADELKDLINGFDAATADSAVFVRAVEDVLARQNQTWVTALVPTT